MKPIPITTFDRAERLADINYVANTASTLPTSGGVISDPRYLTALQIRLEGRVTMPGAGGPAALTADGIAQLIEKITVRGFHRIRSRNEAFYDKRGADAKYDADLFTLGNLPSLPATWNFAVNATNDFRVNFFVPFYPLGFPMSEQLSYIVDTPNYDNLQLVIQWGDAASVFATNGNTVTLSAYGSAVGTPTAHVVARWALGGPSKFANFVPGRIFKYFTEVTGSIPTTTATNVYLQQIPRGNLIRSISVKTGVKSANVSGGNNAYTSLSDTILANIKTQLGTNYNIRYFPHQQDIGVENAVKKGFPYVPGRALLDFAPNGALAEMLDLRGKQAGGTAQTDAAMLADVTGAASQAITFGWEELQAFPMGRLQ